jgi:alanine dehydrogenase
MIVGLPKESKDGERRIALTPDAVRALVTRGHTVCIESNASTGAGFDDSAYVESGAKIVPTAAHAFDTDLVVKVKEIQTDEWRLLRRGGMLFSFLHLGADQTMARELLDRRMTGIAFETVRDAHGGLPILAPMSTIAGELSVPIAAHLLMATNGGKGVLLRDAKVLVAGAGVAGRAAAHAAMRAGASVTVVGRDLAKIAHLATSGIAIATGSIGHAAREYDVIIGAVNIPGQSTPKLLTRADVAAMQPGSVLVEICIDGGGISETSRPTCHAAPTYVEAGITHYCVANMPAAVPRSASQQISDAVLPYVTALADDGLVRAMRNNDGFASGLQIHGSRVTNRAVAAQLNLPFVDLDAVLFSC